jgi:predicted dehydrogenase
MDLLSRPRVGETRRARPRAGSARRSNGSAGLLQVGIVGYGYWGPNVARNFEEAPGSRVVAVSDLRPERLTQVRGRFPHARITTDFRELLADPEVDAVVIATPVSTHYSLALAALQAGKHVLVEKPLASSSQQARELIDTAERMGRTLMVDHTFVYTGAVQKIKELVNSGQLGRLYYYDSVRINLGLFQHDISVMWDLAVHDLAIMDYVLDREPRGTAAIGVAHVPGQPANMGYLTCFFDDDLIAHLHVNWLAPVKVRRTLISGDRQMIVYDDVEPSEKIKVYDKGITVSNGLGNGREPAHDLLVGYRAGDMMAPQLSLTEALKVEAQHFISCVSNHHQPLTDGWAGLRVIQVLEAAERSLAANGARVELA